MASTFHLRANGETKWLPVSLRLPRVTEILSINSAEYSTCVASTKKIIRLSVGESGADIYSHFGE